MEEVKSKDIGLNSDIVQKKRTICESFMRKSYKYLKNIFFKTHQW